MPTGSSTGFVQLYLHHLIRQMRLVCFTLLVLGSFSSHLAAQRVALVGSGSSIPAPLFVRWTEQYNQQEPNFHVRYLPIGTTEGIAELKRGSDFAAGEVPLTSKERSESHLTELPLALIAVVPIYNVPGLHAPLCFSGELLANIFLGQIKSWNSPAIAKLNPGVPLPDLPIKVIYRPGGKGSNYVFTEFLAATSGRCKSDIGVSSSPKWPVGVPAERSSDMADKVKAEVGAIGYVELSYAPKSGIAHAAVLNSSGNFIAASDASVTSACKTVEAPDWDKFAASLSEAHAPDAFPITGFTWFYLGTSSRDPSRSKALADFVHWLFTNGQQVIAPEGYTPLPAPMLEKVRDKANTVLH